MFSFPSNPPRQLHIIFYILCRIRCSSLQFCPSSSTVVKLIVGLQKKLPFKTGIRIPIVQYMGSIASGILGPSKLQNHQNYGTLKLKFRLHCSFNKPAQLHKLMLWNNWCWRKEHKYDASFETDIVCMYGSFQWLLLNSSYFIIRLHFHGKALEIKENLNCWRCRAKFWLVVDILFFLSRY